MSNIYIQEPPTEGKVLISTSAGDFDIELWSKEAPKACRNFIQLILEGYYNDSIFHRCIKGFIAQGGDPTGTGEGGESIYGKPFKDEFHSRLRFVRRGLVAMANAGPNDNGSQFFFTLGSCPELQNKHTIFGKVGGDTIYNLSRFEEGDIGKDDRPEFPHKIIKGEVLKNPYDDIIPRLKIENEVEAENKQKKKKGTKNFKLLSFGDEAEEDEEEFVVATKKMPNRGNSAHDIAMDPSLSSQVAKTEEERLKAIELLRQKLNKEISEKKGEAEDAAKEEEEETAAEMKKRKSKEEIREQIRVLQAELRKKKTDSNSDSESDGPNKKKSKANENGASKESSESQVMQQYHEENQKYHENQKKVPKKGSSRESQTLSLLERFASKVRNFPEEEDEERVESDEDEESKGWLHHRLNFEETTVVAKDASTKDSDWYDITDPRNIHNKRRREKPKSSSSSSRR